MAPIHRDKWEKEFDFKGKHETWNIPTFLIGHHASAQYLEGI